MNTDSLGVRIKTIVVLILFCMIGIGPVPVTSTLGVFIVLFRPLWFRKLVDRIYAE